MKILDIKLFIVFIIGLINVGPSKEMLLWSEQGMFQGLDWGSVSKFLCSSSLIISQNVFLTLILV